MEYKKGDILSDGAEALVNTVNCVGIMGRGVALQFKKAYPGNFKAYEAACKRGEVEPGRMLVFGTGQVTNPRFIVNFPTKRHWKEKSRIEDIEAGLEALVREIRSREIRSIALPPLGCGLGGLDWKDVRPLIETAFAALEDVRVVVYEPGSAPSEERMKHNTTAPPSMTIGRAALVVLMDRYLSGLLDPFVTLLELHKLMYFMQAAGQPLRLSYKEGPYGPYAENLRHVLAKIETHFIVGYEDGGDDPWKKLELVPGALEDAIAVLGNDSATRRRFDRVSNLVNGFESPYGLELLATVHWVVTEKKASTLEDVVQRVHRWNERKKQFSPRQIALAKEVLERQGWTTNTQT